MIDMKSKHDRIVDAINWLRTKHGVNKDASRSLAVNHILLELKVEREQKRYDDLYKVYCALFNKYEDLKNKPVDPSKLISDMDKSWDPLRETIKNRDKMKIDFTDFKRKDTMQQSEQFNEYKIKWLKLLAGFWYKGERVMEEVAKMLAQADIDREAAASEIAFYKELAERSTSKTFPPGIYKGTIEQFEKMIPGFADMMMQHCKPAKPTPYSLLDKAVMYKGIRYGVEIGKYRNGQNKITLIPPPHLKVPALEPTIMISHSLEPDTIIISSFYNEIVDYLVSQKILVNPHGYKFLANCGLYKLNTTSNEN